MTNDDIRWYRSPRAKKAPSYQAVESEIIPDEARQVRQRIVDWEGYSPTPLVEMPELARKLGVGRVRAKHEGWRQPLGNFKALGGAFALIEHARRETEATSGPVTVNDLIQGRIAAPRHLHYTCATDGSHGYSVAWGAHLIGAACTIYLPAAVSAEREARIASYGAKIVRLQATYDEAVAESMRIAQIEGHTVISDMSYPDCTEAPRYILQAYTVLAEEIVASCQVAPTHVFLQIGCGGLAGAVAGHMALAYGSNRPTFVAVEPLNADCAFRSAEAGRSAIVKGDHATIMGGLACGEMSHIAWPIVDELFDHFLAISDDHARAAMRSAAAEPNPNAIVAGEAGIAGLAGLQAAVQTEMGRHLGLDENSDVVVVITEGAADQGIYQAITGKAPCSIEPELYRRP